jgi:hypothetical protein
LFRFCGAWRGRKVPEPGVMEIVTGVALEGDGVAKTDLL